MFRIHFSLSLCQSHSHEWGMRRRRHTTPWLPGFWLLLSFLAILGSVLGYFYALGLLTQFEKLPPEAPVKTTAGVSASE